LPRVVAKLVLEWWVVGQPKKDEIHPPGFLKRRGENGRKKEGGIRKDVPECHSRLGLWYDRKTLSFCARCLQTGGKNADKRDIPGWN